MYKWRSGSRFRIDAAIAYEELERLRRENDGELNSDIVLADAKYKRSPLHAAFEWDDSIAAHQHRKAQANQLILSVEVVRETNGQEPARAYVYTKVQQDDGSKHGFYTTPSILAQNEQMYNETLERARGQLKSFRERFEFLSELSRIFAAIDELPD